MHPSILENLAADNLGINTAIISPGGGNVGIGFAVPINIARLVMEQLVHTAKSVVAALEPILRPRKGIKAR